MDANDSISEESLASADEKQQPSRSRSGFCCGCLLAAAVLSIVFGLLLVMLFSSPGEIVERASRSLSPQDTVQRATAQLSEAQMQAVRGVKPTVQVQIADADINAYLAEHRGELGLPSGLKAPRVAFGEEFIEVSVRTKIAFVPVRIRAKVVPEVVDGKLKLQVTKVRAGKLGITGLVRDSLINILTDSVHQRLDQSGIKLKSVEVRPGFLTFTGALKATKSASP